MYHIQPWITPGRPYKAWQADALLSLHVILPKHLALPAVYKNISPISVWCEKETCHSLQHSLINCSGQTPRGKVLVMSVLRDKSWSHHTRNSYRNTIFLWLYTTGNLLCTVPPPCIQLHMYVHPNSRQWTCQSSVPPASIWHAVKRDLEIRAAVQLSLLITDLYEIAWQNVNNSAWHPTCYHMPEMFGGWNRMT